MTTVSIAVKKLDDAVSITLDIANTQDVPIYAFTKLWIYGDDGSIQLDPENAYSSIGKAGELTLGKIVYPVPKEILVESRIIPYVLTTLQKKRHCGTRHGFRRCDFLSTIFWKLTT
jgi:hypothetical protein